MKAGKLFLLQCLPNQFSDEPRTQVKEVQHCLPKVWLAPVISYMIFT